MSLVIGYMAIRNGFEIILQELQSSIHILLADKGCHLGDGNASLLGTLAIHVVGQEINFGVNPTKYNTCIKSYLSNNNTSYTMNYSEKVNFNNT